MSHSMFSPSSAHRWTQCPGSLVLSQGIESTGGEASREGTMLHDAMQKHMEKLKPWSAFNLTEEQTAACAMCADYVRAIPKEDVYYEVKVEFGKSLGFDNKKCFGTSDVLIAKGDTLRVVDYKFGRKWVDPQGNWQGILYMIGAMQTMDIAGYSFDNYEFEILQPRVGEEVSNGIYKLSAEELDDKAMAVRSCMKEVERAIQFYKAGSNEDWNQQFLKPSEEACTFCPAAATCPKLIDIAMMDMEEMERLAQEFPAGYTMEWADNDDLSRRFDRLPILKEYIRAVEEEVMKRLLDGKEIKNYHLVKGREGNREWIEKDLEQIKGILQNIMPEDKVFSQPDLLSPAKIQSNLVYAGGMSKQEAKRFVDDLCVRAPAKPTVAHVDKGGTPWVNEENIVKEFDNV